MSSNLPTRWQSLWRYPDTRKRVGGRRRASFALRQLAVRPVWESASTQAILRAAAEGLGVAVLPERMARRAAEDGDVCLRPLADPIERTLHIVWHKSKYLTQTMQSFRALCRSAGTGKL